VKTPTRGSRFLFPDRHAQINISHQVGVVANLNNDICLRDQDQFFIKREKFLVPEGKIAYFCVFLTFIV